MYTPVVGSWIGPHCELRGGNQGASEAAWLWASFKRSFLTSCFFLDARLSDSVGSVLILNNRTEPVVTLGWSCLAVESRKIKADNYSFFCSHIELYNISVEKFEHQNNNSKKFFKISTMQWSFGMKINKTHIHLGWLQGLVSGDYSPQLQLSISIFQIE